MSWRAVLAVACLLACQALAAPGASAVTLTWHGRLLEGDNNTATFQITSVSCPTSKLCALVDRQGNVFVSTNPIATLPPPAPNVWKQKNIDGTNVLSGISCLPSMCVAVDTQGNALVSTNPFQSSPTWSIPLAIDHPNQLTGISCPATNLCVATDNVGQVVTSTDPAGGPSQWHVASIDPGTGHVINVVSCASTTLCAAFETTPPTGVGQPRHVNSLSSTNPAGGSSAWAIHPDADSDGPGLFSFQALDCVTNTFCIGADSIGTGGEVLTSTTPTSNAVWKANNVDTGYNTPFGLSCASPNFCVMVDDGGRAFTTTDPTGSASAWTKIKLDSRWGLTALSCSRQALCVAGDQSANVVVGHLPPPNTTITGFTPAHHAATFKFAGIGLTTGFQCELNKKGATGHFSSCSSPKTYSQLKPGSYTFLVRAFNLAGPDPTPASKAFQIT